MHADGASTQLELKLAAGNGKLSFALEGQLEPTQRDFQSCSRSGVSHQPIRESV
jgi:hypothetical protein